MIDVISERNEEEHRKLQNFRLGRELDTSSLTSTARGVDGWWNDDAEGR
jgi:hypothetical protein